MTHDSTTRITALLVKLRRGDERALDELFPLVYDELHRLAKRQRAAWDGNETLNTTALLHEAYLKLSRRQEWDFNDRAHFLRTASRAMRHILVNYAERRSARKRGGDAPRVGLDEIEGQVGAPGDDDRVETIILLDRALSRLEEVRARHARIVECRVFGGMTIDETAEALEISAATVSRGWAMAQAWLRREVGDVWA